MSNPWLAIPLADYEGHMKSAEVQQLDALADLFVKALAYCRPASVAILGVAGGNGLEHIDRSVTRRILGLDINPHYLEATRQRHADHRQLELYCVDLAERRVDLEPVQMVHAALVFEHAGVNLCLENAVSMVAADGVLSAVLQLPSESNSGVGASPFSSMQSLQSDFSLIDPAWLQEILAQHGFGLVHQTRRSVAAGKGFWMGVFSRSA